MREEHNKSSLDNCYNSLGVLFNSLEAKEQYTCPYLVIPTDKYWNSQYKILICGKETNSWGEKEGYKGKLISHPDKWEEIKKDLLSLYDNKINKEWGGELGGGFWPFYRSIREETEENFYNSNYELKYPNVGVCAANISLLGMKYLSKGFDDSLIEIKDRDGRDIGLKNDFLQLTNALHPDFLICLVGYKKSVYSNFIEQTLGLSYSEFSFYEIIKDQNNSCKIFEVDRDLIPQKNMLCDFCFGHGKIGNIKIILAPHPERKCKIKLTAFKNFIFSEIDKELPII